MIPYFPILQEYLRDYAIPGMLQEGWATKAAKEYGWEKAARGADFHIDQPLRTHILNGLYALTRLLEYLGKRRYFSLREGEFKRLLVLYTLHDAYKDPAISQQLQGTGTFNVPLKALDALVERMRLRQFAPVTDEDLRLASVSLLSHKVGDISASTPGTTKLLTLVHLADSCASQQTARDYQTTENYLRTITRGDAVTARHEARIRQRLPKESEAPDEVLPELACYYHELDDYRGLSTLLIHQATEDALLPFDLHPLLYFANAILYIGVKGLSIESHTLRTSVAQQVFVKVQAEGKENPLTIARGACDPRKGMKIEKYAYLFCSPETLLDAVSDEIRLGAAKSSIKGAVSDYAAYAIPEEATDEKLHIEHWFTATKLIMAAENIAQALLPEESLAWLFLVFQTPVPVATKIRDNVNQLNKGGVPNYCYIIAYHYLSQTRFLPDQRSWLATDRAGIQQQLKASILAALKAGTRPQQQLAFVEKELGIQEDLKAYLDAHLVFSFDASRSLLADPLLEYEKERRKSHKRLCTLCNRLIPSAMKKSDIKTTIAEQPAQIFSNRRLPTQENKGDMMVWCPMCYLEFMLRRLSGHSYPENSDYNASYRLNLYILPDYSFTPELWRASGEALLGEFHQQSTTVSKLSLRGSRDHPAIPRRWLEHRTVDEDLLEQVRTLFAEQAERMKTRGKQGDRLTFSLKHPNYMLFTYDNVVSKSAESGLKPTRTEVWGKALYAATLLHFLTGARVYITDKPYLTFTRPEEMKTIIEMEGLPPLFAGLFPISNRPEQTVATLQRASESSARLPLATLSTLLDLLAAVWEINAALFPQKPREFRNLDKQIASVLEEVNTNHLAGATLYKMRERDGAAPYPAFTTACQLLLPQGAQAVGNARSAFHEAGYTLMLDQEGAWLMNLAQEITDTCLQLYVPSGRKEGRTHRFETLFRTGVEAMKVNITGAVSSEERVARVAGALLKRLERLLDNRQQGYGQLYGMERIQAVEKLARLLVLELFERRCGQSIAKLTHEENQLADAIYFLTIQGVEQYWLNKRHTDPVAEDANAPV